MFGIMCVATATEDNPNFAGEVKTYYYGKKQTRLDDEGKVLKQYVDEYGYTTKGAASRSLKCLEKWFNSRVDRFHYWTYEFSVVEL